MIAPLGVSALAAGTAPIDDRTAESSYGAFATMPAIQRSRPSTSPSQVRATAATPNRASRRDRAIQGLASSRLAMRQIAVAAVALTWLGLVLGLLLWIAGMVANAP